MEVAVGRDARTVAILIGCGFALLCLAWAGGSPAGAIPDEPAHLVKAYATATGQFAGARILPDLSEMRPRSAAWFEVSGRSYLLPARLAPPPDALCFAFNPDKTADCRRPALASAATDAGLPAFTHVATYNPFPYVVTGFALRGSPTYQTAVWRGRLASVAVCAIFVLWGAWLTQNRGILALASFGIAIMPAAAFLAGSLNTSGLEISSALCFWAALLHVASRPQPASRGWIAVAVSGVVLALTRPLGAVLVPCIVAILGVYIGGAGRKRVLRSRSAPGVATAFGIGAACIASFIWSRHGTPHPPIDWSLARASLGPALRDLPNQARDVIGIFGFNNTTMPNAVYAFGAIVLAALGIAGLRAGTWAERCALVCLAAGATLTSLALAVLIEAQIGFGMQARYIMPLTVGLPLLAGDILVRRWPADLSRISWAACAMLGSAATLHLAAALSNQHRYAVGLNASWLPPWQSRWSPDGGALLWLGIALSGCLCLWWAAAVAARAQPVTSGAFDAVRPASTRPNGQQTAWKRS